MTDRAKELMKLAAKYIREHCPDGHTYYDDADCDGWCLADDIEAEAYGMDDSKSNRPHTTDEFLLMAEDAWTMQKFGNNQDLCLIAIGKWMRGEYDQALEMLK